MFGTNPQHTGYYNTNMPSDLLIRKKWNYKTNGMVLSSAVVANNTIYIGSDDSCLYALDTTGVLKWKFKSNGIIRSTPAVNDTIVYFNNYGGIFYALSANTGLELWHLETEGEMHFSHRGLYGWLPADSLMDDPWDFYTSSPVLTDTIVYVGSGRFVYAVHVISGEKIWEYNADDVIHSTPAVADGIICFGGWSGKFYALDALTGTDIWCYLTGTDPTHLMQGIQSSPSIIDSIVVFGARDAGVYALNLYTGAEIWADGFGATWMPSSFAISDLIAFTGSSEGVGLKGINLLNGNIIRSTSKHFYFTFSTPAVGSNTVFVGCMNGSLFAGDTDSGYIKCRFDTDGRLSDPLDAIKDDGSLNPEVFGPVSGYPYEQAVEYVRRLMTAGSIASTPFIADDVIYFGSSDSSIYAVHDQGTCKPAIRASENVMDLGLINNSILFDTSLFIRNIGECADSFHVYVNKNTSTVPLSAIEVDPSEFTIPAGDFVEIHITINPSDLESKSYLLRVFGESRTNPYKSSTTEITFQIDAGSEVADRDKELFNLVYPNPFDDIIHLITEECCTLYIFNTVGEMVLQKELEGTETELDVSHLPAGIYILTVHSPNNLQNEKIVKEQ